MCFPASDLLRIAVEVAGIIGRERGGREQFDGVGTWGAFCIACVLLVTRKNRELHPQPPRLLCHRCIARHHITIAIHSHW